MPNQILIGPFTKGLRQDIKAFYIDNDAFPFLYNFYSWRGRIKRKRGTSLLGRLSVQVESVLSPSSVADEPWLFGPLPIPAGTANPITYYGLGTTASIVPGSINLSLVIGIKTYTIQDTPLLDGNLIVTGGIVSTITGITPGTTTTITMTSVDTLLAVNSLVFIENVVGMTNLNNNYYTILSKAGNNIVVNVNSTTFPAYVSGGNVYLVAGGINYGSGTINIVSPVTSSGSYLVGNFSYYPGLPVMGLKDLVTQVTNASYPILMAFDTRFSYQSNQADTNAFLYNVTFFKFTNIPFEWTASDANQFYTTNWPITTVNLGGSLWATNNTPGFQFKPIVSWTLNSTPSTSANLRIINHNLIVGDYIWINETGMSPPDLNTYKVVAVPDQNTVTINIVLNATPAGGIAQYLTNNAYVAKNITNLAAPGAPLQVTINANGFNLGDRIQFEYVGGMVQLNGLIGTITSIVDPNNFIVNINTTGFGAYTTGGIAIDLNESGGDGIRWYDGDPTAGTGIPQGSSLNPIGTGKGWVNFAPPLTAAVVSIAGSIQDKYYLIGALAILPFKDRLLFFGPYIQSSTGLPIHLQNAVIWSQSGTPYYAPLVLPTNQTATANAYFVDQSGLGGFLISDIAYPITTIGMNQNALIIGYSGGSGKDRLVYTGNDTQPFIFFTINVEFPSSATFSTINMDKGSLDIGQYGITTTDQQSSQRIDLIIPDEVFEIQDENDGALRVNAVRDFVNERIYWTYPPDNSDWKFPTQTLMFNYRDNTWAIFYENYTAQGFYRPSEVTTWKTLAFPTWQSWTDPWNFGTNQPLIQQCISGNPQGFVLVRDIGVSEAQSGMVSAITSVGGLMQITSYNHCVSNANPNLGIGDYLNFSGLATINSRIAQVVSIVDDNNFIIDVVYASAATITGITLGNPTIITAVNNFLPTQTVLISGVVGTTQLNGNVYVVTASTGGSFTIDVDSTAFTPYVSGGTASVFYAGNSTFSRLTLPLLQTRQFPFYWDQGRQTRLCVQKYLLDATDLGEVTLNVYLSQDPNDPWNDPANSGPLNSLEYTQVLFTCPESTNLGLTPFNSNLQSPISPNQDQIWHRVNTSLMGDTVQIGITLSDTQMRSLETVQSEITLHAIQLLVERGPLLA